jgi:hypothetical protein
MNVYSHNPTEAEEVTLHDLESLSVVPAKSQGQYVSKGKCIVALYRPMPWPAQLTSNDCTRRYLAKSL